MIDKTDVFKPSNNLNFNTVLMFYLNSYTRQLELCLETLKDFTLFSMFKKYEWCIFKKIYILLEFLCRVLRIIYESPLKTEIWDVGRN